MVPRIWHSRSAHRSGASKCRRRRELRSRGRPIVKHSKKSGITCMLHSCGYRINILPPLYHCLVTTETVTIVAYSSAIPIRCSVATPVIWRPFWFIIKPRIAIRPCHWQWFQRPRSWTTQLFSHISHSVVVVNNDWVNNDWVVWVV